MPGNAMIEAKMRLARCALDAQRNPGDQDALDRLERVRAEYVRARTAHRVARAVAGSPLDRDARRRIAQALLDDVGAAP